MSKFIKVTQKEVNVLSKAMTRQEYNDLRGWCLPENENGADEGYLILDESLPANTELFDGFICWKPSIVFAKTFKPTPTKLSFGQAIDAIRNGELVTRSGWNGKGMFIFLVQGSTFNVNRSPLNAIFTEGTEINYLPRIDMRTADGSIVPWLASQADLLSSDWEIK